MNKKLSSKEMIQMHINPPKTLDLPSKKGLIPTNSTEEIESTIKSLKSVKEFLHLTRVDRKQSRSEAVWIPDKRLSKITRRAGKTLSHFGFTEYGQTYLTPEETLYLIETNYLELFWNGVPFSIEQAYTVLLTNKESFEKYRTFKELAGLGYRIQEPEISNKRKNHSESSTESKNKKIKSSEGSLDFESTLFENLKQEGPKTANIVGNCSTLYNVYLPKKSIKNTTPDIEIIKKPEGNEFSLQCVSDNSSSTVTAFSGNESVSFYQFHEVDIANK